MYCHDLSPVGVVDTYSILLFSQVQLHDILSLFFIKLNKISLYENKLQTKIQQTNLDHTQISPRPYHRTTDLQYAYFSALI